MINQKPESEMQLQDSKVKELFDAVDDDGGGTVSIAEFESWVTGKADLPDGHDENAAEEAARLAVCLTRPSCTTVT